MRLNRAWERVESLLGWEICSERTLAGICNILLALMFLDSSWMYMTGGALTRDLALEVISGLFCAFALITAAIGYWTGQVWARHVSTGVWLYLAITASMVFALMAWWAWAAIPEPEIKRIRRSSC